MKKNILMVTVAGMVILSGFSAVGQQTKKATEARKNVTKANKELTEAKNDSVEDYMRFKKQAEISINENQVKITELKARKADENKDTKVKYDQKVAALEKRNDDLRKKINGSGSVKTTMWASFKREFNHDLSEFGTAFKDIGVNNAK